MQAVRVLSRKCSTQSHGAVRVRKGGFFPRKPAAALALMHEKRHTGRMLELTIFTCVVGGVVALISVVYLVIVDRQYKKEKVEQPVPPAAKKS